MFRSKLLPGTFFACAAVSLFVTLPTPAHADGWELTGTVLIEQVYGDPATNGNGTATTGAVTATSSASSSGNNTGQNLVGTGNGYGRSTIRATWEFRTYGPPNDHFYVATSSSISGSVSGTFTGKTYNRATADAVTPNVQGHAEIGIPTTFPSSPDSSSYLTVDVDPSLGGRRATKDLRMSASTDCTSTSAMYDNGSGSASASAAASFALGGTSATQPAP